MLTSEAESPSQPSNPPRLTRLPRIDTRAGGGRILDFDIENRPLSYWYEGQCTAEVTAIAASFVGTDHVYCWVLGKHDPVDMLTKFTALYDEAEMVTGHYIRKHDLPILNGAMIDHGLPVLSPKKTCDTRLDKVRWKDLPASQEAICDLAGIPLAKENMSQAQWREANRLTSAGIKETRRRVVGDVIQHKAMRDWMLEHKLLVKPKDWRP